LDLFARRAEAADADDVTNVVALAFARDPLWGRAMAVPSGSTDHHAEFWRVFVDGALRYAETWITVRGEATSIWIPPNGTEMTAEQEEHLERLVTQHLGDQAGSYLELLARFDANHPREEPHFYLSLLGTHPDFRGHGVGMRLLAHDLELIDGRRAPAYLESSNPANDHRYARLGFKPIGEFSYPGDGPKVTTMWRNAH
jgi:GNAT superfamily N-acetyltransferase